MMLAVYSHFAFQIGTCLDAGHAKIEGVCLSVVLFTAVPSHSEDKAFQTVKEHVLLDAYLVSFATAFPSRDRTCPSSDMSCEF